MLKGQLGNRYEIIEQIGSGGMAVVYKAKDIFLNRLVTIKALRPEYSADENFLKLFRREAQAVASLSHPNIVAIYDVGQENDIPYLVMQYIDGEDLKSKIQREGRLDPKTAVEIALQVLDALEHAHRHGIIHRDIKTHNILISKDMEVKLTDFGIAKETTQATITQTAAITGSMHYISPEQARGEPADARSDIYSMGVVLYEMLTGTVPFQGENPIAVAVKHIQEDPELPSSRAKNIPLSLERVIMKAMEKNPYKRFSSAAEMAGALEEIYVNELGGTKKIGFEPGMLYPETPPEEDYDEFEYDEFEEESRVKRSQRRPHKGNRALTITAVLLALALLAAAGFALSSYFGSAEKEVQVPNVVGMSLDEAKKTLEDLGLTVEVKRQSHPTIPENTVIEQDIKPGVTVKLPQTIVLTVSAGPELVTVPSLYNKSIDEAREILEELGLELAEPVSEGYSDDVPEGFIYRQIPSPGKKVPKGTEVIVYVSQGSKEITVPDLTGLTLEKARAKLEEQGLTLDADIQWAESDEYERGIVIDQNPKPGASVSKNTAVKVTLSRGRESEEEEENSWTTTTAEISVPSDGREHMVLVTVTDQRGTSRVYENTHPSGTRLRVPVRFTGNQATVKVYIDGSLVDEKTVSAR
ncbi:MAG: Serine/threonine protein kinase with PASTA sensor(S) [Clostridia bacterium 41_269]|nr:MAG: Serine/threonine protein kinase with PASTA sensor(S) [Clostridia bacterium 41_269]